MVETAASVFYCRVCLWFLSTNLFNIEYFFVYEPLYGVTFAKYIVTVKSLEMLLSIVQCGALWELLSYIQMRPFSFSVFSRSRGHQIQW